MENYLLEAALLMLAAYLLGAIIGCFGRRILTSPRKTADSTAKPVAATAAAAGASAASTAEVRDAPDPVQPKIETVAQPEPPEDATIAESARFERVLTSGQSAGTAAPLTASEAPVEPTAAPEPVTPPEPIAASQSTPAPEPNPAQGEAATTADAPTSVSGAGAAAAAAAVGGLMAATSQAREEEEAPTEPLAPAQPLAETESTAPAQPLAEPTTVPESTSAPAEPAPEADDTSGQSGAVAAATAAAAAAAAGGIMAAASQAGEDAAAPAEPEPVAPSAAPAATPPSTPPIETRLPTAGGSTGAASVAAAVAAAPIDAPPVDDLRRIAHIDTQTANALNHLGYTRFAQIAEWKPADVARVNQALGDDRATREGWMEQAKLLSAGKSTAFARGASGAGAPLATAPSAVLPAPEALPAPAPAAAPAAPEPAPAPQPAATEPAPAQDATNENNPSGQSTVVAGAVAAAAAAAGAAAAAATATAAPAETAPIVAPAPAVAPAQDDLRRIDGIDASAQNLLAGHGVATFAEIANWGPGKVADIDNALGMRGRVSRENWQEQAKLLAAGKETAYSRRLAAGETTADAPHATWSVGTSAAALAAGTAAATASSAAAVAAAAPATVAARAPAAANDDLRRIDGIDASAQTLLASRGVTSFAQIAGWGPGEVSDIDNALGMRGRVSRENWQEQAKLLAAGKETAYSRRLAAGNTTADTPHGTWGLPVSAAAIASSSALSSATYREGTVAAAGGVATAPFSGQHTAQTAATRQTESSAVEQPSAPHAPQPLSTPALAPVADDSAATTTPPPAQPPAPEPAPAAEPNASAEPGANLPEPAPSAPAARPARLADAIRQNAGQNTGMAGAIGAAGAASGVAGMRSVRSQLLSGSGGPKPDETDDLKKIRGIGVLIEKKLNAMGIYTYEQIANWSAGDIERISASLDFKGRIEREGWVQQARILASGGQTEFSKRIT